MDFTGKTVLITGAGGNLGCAAGKAFDVFTFTPLMAAMRMKSAARVRNAANVEGNGIAPRLASPIAAPIITCSAMNAW